MNNNVIKVNGSLVIPKQEISDFCKKNHIRKLSVFGSILGNDFGPESDIDLLVEFEPEHIPGYFGLSGMEREFSRIMGGRKVDLNTYNGLSPYFRDDVVAEAKALYEKR